MRVVIQRVRRACVDVDGETVSSIDTGMLVLVGVARGDTDEDVMYIANKVAHLRVFNDDDGRLNSSVRELDGEVLLVSQFTLLADTRRGRRPSFGAAEEPGMAALRMENLERALVALGIRVRSGQFQANMDVTLVNWGPVTIVIDSKEKEQPRRQKTSNFSDGVA